MKTFSISIFLLVKNTWSKVGTIEKEYGGESVVSNSSDRNELALEIYRKCERAKK
ncbi:hypothetical protein RhiirB3_452507 [Rhizophagus irregularis]|nr:hypothetical protein RhiirB3_452507 [Rhizophagus irregularis]